MAAGDARTLPVRPDPHPDETLASYFIRAAAHLGVPPQTLLIRTGLLGGSDHGNISYVPGWTIALGTRELRRVSDVTRLPEAAVSGMLLSRYDGVALDLFDLRSDYARTWEHAWAAHWIYFTGSHVCPRCLEESGGAWRLAWKLPWSFACVKHGCLLADTCPSCRRRLSLETNRAHALAAPSLRSDPTSCRLPKHPVGVRAKRDNKLCGYPLGDLKVEALASWPSLVETQRHINEALKGLPQRVLQQEVPPLEYFGNLRSLCTMLLVAGSPEATATLPPTVHEAFVLHAKERKGYLFRRRRAPASAALMAAVAPVAVDMLASHSVQNLADKLEPFVARVRASTPHVSAHFLRRFAFSGELEEAFVQSWARLRRTKRPNSKAISVMPDSHFVALEADYVPQLLWKQVYEHRFAEFIRSMHEDHARRFCSMALLRFAGGYTWNSAAELLGLPGRYNQDKGSWAMRLLKEDGTDALFVARLRELARQVVEDVNAINYGARRRALSDFEIIAAADWDDLRVAANLTSWVGSRRRYASAWVWCHLTSGDYRLSPALRGAGSHTYEKYRAFINRPSFNQLKDSLIPYGSTLLPNMMASRSSVPVPGAGAATSRPLPRAIGSVNSGEGEHGSLALPPHARPLPGESFASYLDRLAASRDIYLITAAKQTGICDGEPRNRIPAGYGISLSSSRAARFAREARLSEDKVQELLLAHYDGIAIDLSDQDLAKPGLLRRDAQQQWAYFIGSHLCPCCLWESGGTWKLVWKLPWSFACAVHENLLVDTCPSCGRRTAIGRQDRRSSPAFPYLVPKPTRCRNAVPKGGESPRSAPCDYPLDSLEAQSLRGWPRITEAQSRLDEALTGTAQTIAREQVSSTEYFMSLRFLCRLFLYWGTLEELGDLPPVARDAFAAGLWDPEKGVWFRPSQPQVGAPTSAALMAAVTPTAMDILDAESVQELRASLMPFVDRARAHKVRFRAKDDYLQHAPRLAAVFDV